MQEYLLAFFKSSILLFSLVAMYGVAAPNSHSKPPFSEPESADDLKLNVGGEHAALEGLRCLSDCTIVGMAYRLDTGKFVYREEHQLFTPAYHEVFYRNSVGEAFAYKLIDSADYPFAPNFWCLDFRLQQLQAVKRQLEVDGSSIGVGDASYVHAWQEEISRKSFYELFAFRWGKQDGNRSQEIALLQQFSKPYLPSKNLIADRSALDPAFQPLIADAGFDAFIQNNWKALLSEAIEFKFVVPSRSSSVAMSLDSIDISKCRKNVISKADPLHTVALQNKKLNCFRIQAKNWLIKQFLGNIYLVYDEQKRLMMFKGLSNIRDDGNKRLYTYIMYNYI